MPASPQPQRRNTSGAVMDVGHNRDPAHGLFKGRPAAMSLKHPLPSQRGGGDASLVIANPAARPSLDAAMEEFR